MSVNQFPSYVFESFVPDYLPFTFCPVFQNNVTSVLSCLTTKQQSKPLSSSSEKEDLRKSLETVSNEIQKLENAILCPSTIPAPSDSEREQILRARNAVLKSNNYSSVFKWVPQEYYSFPLSKRANILGAHSTFQLCKSMLMENKAVDPAIRGGSNDDSYTPFYLVVLQYEAVIDIKKLQSEIRALKPIKSRLEPSKFDLRLAAEEDNASITGYSHNAVTPFGLLKKVPIILAKDIVTNMDMTQFIWMGGGHKRLKVGVAVKEFINFFKPMVLDVTSARTSSCDNENDFD